MPEPGSLIPGSYQYRADLRRPGKRFVPAPTPWQAIWNTVLRNYAPWGPLTADPSPTGTGGIAGKIAGKVPYVGGLLETGLAGRAAGQQKGQMVEVPPAPSTARNILDTIGNTLGLVPGGVGGAAMSGAKLAMTGVKAGVGAADFFGSDYVQGILTSMRGPDAGQSRRVAQLWDEDEQRPQRSTNFARRAEEPTVAGIPTSFNEPTSAPAPTTTQTDPEPAPTSTSTADSGWIWWLVTATDPDGNTSQSYTTAPADWTPPASNVFAYSPTNTLASESPPPIQAP